jgi:5-enolpyruvylshikimate-3-phosphate synthase
MALLRVRPSKLKGEVTAPPSKSYTHRGFAVGLLARGEMIFGTSSAREAISSRARTSSMSEIPGPRSAS